MPYAEVKQLYYQNPDFGFYVLKFTSEWLFQSAQAKPMRTPDDANAIGADVL